MLSRWRPFHDVARFNREFDRFFRTGGGNGEVTSFAPAVDIEETDAAVVLSADLPGIDEKDIELGISDGVLTLKAKKKEEHEEKKKDYHLTERSYGSVRRSFRIPEGVETDKIKAAFSKGVLEVTLPKTKEVKAKQRKIPVKAS